HGVFRAHDDDLGIGLVRESLGDMTPGIASGQETIADDFQRNKQQRGGDNDPGNEVEHPSRLDGRRGRLAGRGGYWLIDTGVHAAGEPSFKPSSASNQTEQVAQLRQQERPPYKPGATLEIEIKRQESGDDRAGHL